MFEVLVKLDEYQDEHWQENNFASSFDSLLTKSIEELMKANMTTAVENLKNWKDLIWQEDRKRLIQQEFLLCLQPVWNQTILQRLSPFKDFVVTFMTFSFALTLIEKEPMTLSEKGVWNMTLQQEMNLDYSTSYAIPSIIFCLTLFYYFIPMMHQLDYGMTYFVKWRNWWNEKINTEELTAEMIGIVFDKTKNLTADDFKAVVANIKAILLDMMRGRYPFVLSWPPLSNEHFNEEFRKKVDDIVSKVKKPVVLT